MTRIAPWLAIARSWLISWPVTLICRLVLGGAFVAAGWSKIGHQGELILTVQNFEILPSFLVRPFGMALPWVELISGALLIVGLLTISASSLLALVNSAFLIALGINLVRGHTVDCGCFGDPEPLSWWIFIRDIGFLLMSLQILAAPQGFLSLDRALSAFRRGRAQRGHGLETTDSRG